MSLHLLVSDLVNRIDDLALESKENREAILTSLLDDFKQDKFPKVRFLHLTNVVRIWIKRSQEKLGGQNFNGSLKDTNEALEILDILDSEIKK